MAEGCGLGVAGGEPEIAAGGDGEGSEGRAAGDGEGFEGAILRKPPEGVGGLGGIEEPDGAIGGGGEGGGGDIGKRGLGERSGRAHVPDGAAAGEKEGAIGGEGGIVGGDGEGAGLEVAGGVDFSQDAGALGCIGGEPEVALGICGESGDLVLAGELGELRICVGRVTGGAISSGDISNGLRAIGEPDAVGAGGEEMRGFAGERGDGGEGSIWGELFEEIGWAGREDEPGGIIGRDHQVGDHGFAGGERENGLLAGGGLAIDGSGCGVPERAIRGDGEVVGVDGGGLEGDHRGEGEIDGGRRKKATRFERLGDEARRAAVAGGWRAVAIHRWLMCVLCACMCFLWWLPRSLVEGVSGLAKIIGAQGEVGKCAALGGVGGGLEIGLGLLEGVGARGVDAGGDISKELLHGIHFGEHLGVLLIGEILDGDAGEVSAQAFEGEIEGAGGVDLPGAATF